MGSPADGTSPAAVDAGRDATIRTGRGDELRKLGSWRIQRRGRRAQVRYQSHAGVLTDGTNPCDCRALVLKGL
jgi:hypothetical protein